jgi:fructoselysine and glucoselysine-specific PTS system IIA component
MRKFLIAAHGTFSSGLKSSLDIIIGRMENVFIIDAYVGENNSVEQELSNILQKLDVNDELVVFSDLMGGSITNQIIRFGLRENVHILSGVNLPLLIDVMLADEDKPIQEIIARGITLAKEQVVYVNQLLNKENTHD